MVDESPIDERTPEEFAAETLWARKRRSDLVDSFSVVLYTPSGYDDSKFAAEVAEIVQESVKPLVQAGLLDAAAAEEIEVFPYSTGPAAQEWAKCIVDLYHLAQPYINDGASLLEWGGALVFLTKQLMKREAGNSSDPKTHTSSGMDLGNVYSRNALIAVCYYHIVSLYRPTAPVSVDVHCRGNEYSSPDHPGGFEQFLIVFVTDTRKISYLINGRGRVIEHIVETDGSASLMPIPNLFHDEVEDWSTVFPVYSTTIE
ncbi:MAG: hypothetical protein M9947_07295 [Thermomicrobiales bacterium]|nr:hypothetical protein [Thermomicrobiales bacterium]